MQVVVPPMHLGYEPLIHQGYEPRIHQGHEPCLHQPKRPLHIVNGERDSGRNVNVKRTVWKGVTEPRPDTGLPRS
jgi:hypothetical protein